MFVWLLHVLCDGMLTRQGPMPCGAWWLHCMLVISMCFHAYLARPNIGQALMNVWYAIVFVIIACVRMIICLYDLMRTGRGSMPGGAWWLTNLLTERGLMSGGAWCRSEPEAGWESMPGMGRWMVGAHYMIIMYRMCYFWVLTKLCAYGFVVMVSGTSSLKGKGLVWSQRINPCLCIMMILGFYSNNHFMECFWIFRKRILNVDLNLTNVLVVLKNEIFIS